MGQYTVSNLATRPRCPRCDSSHVVRNGRRKNISLYLCRDCSRQFRSTGALHRLRFPPDLIGEAIERYYRGASLRRVAAELGRDRSCPSLSRNTVSRWVQTFSAAAGRHLADRTPRPAAGWLGVSLATRTRGRECGLCFIIDQHARYVLACHLSVDRNADAARQALVKALLRAGGAISSITTDDVELWRGAVASVLGDEWPSPVLDLGGCRPPDRLEEALRSQAARVRRMGGLEQGLQYLEGWTVFHNHLGGYAEAGGKTPGEVAGVDCPFATWADVVRAGP